MRHTGRRPVPRMLGEGMRAGDLNDLVLPLISVDEYVSTVDQKAIAIGFYVHDQEAANDLNRFLQKSPVAILSSEVSPAPDQHGYFMVFIELMDNDKLADNVANILKEMAPLCEIDHWKMHVRNNDGVLAFTTENFRRALIRAKRMARRRPENDRGQVNPDQVLEFLTPSLLQDACLRHGRLHIATAAGEQRDYRVVAFAPIKYLAEEYRIFEKAIGLDLPQVIRTNRVAAMLGEGWIVNEIGPYTLIQHNSSYDCLLLHAPVHQHGE